MTLINKNEIPQQIGYGYENNFTAVSSIWTVDVVRFTNYALCPFSVSFNLIFLFHFRINF